MGGSGVCLRGVDGGGGGGNPRALSTRGRSGMMSLSSGPAGVGLAGPDRADGRRMALRRLTWAIGRAGTLSCGRGPLGGALWGRGPEAERLGMVIVKGLGGLF